MPPRVLTQRGQILLFILKRKFSFHFLPFICRSFKSVTYFDLQDFVKTPNFDSYDIINHCLNKLDLRIVLLSTTLYVQQDECSVYYM